MWIIYFVVLLDIIGFGIILPVFPFFASKLGAGPEMVMFCIALYMAAAFFSAPILGKLSDLYGRKPIIAFSLIGATFGYLILAYADSLWMVILARLVGGLMAGSFVTAQAYVTDMTTLDNRAKFMGIFGATMALGYVIGPAIGSIFGGATFENADFRGPCFMAAASAAACVLVIFFVKESRQSVTSQDSVTDSHSTVFTLKYLFQRHTLLLIFLCGLLYNFAAGLYETIFPLWAESLSVIDGPRGMLPMLVGSGVVFIVVQAALFSPLTKRYSGSVLLSCSALGIAGSCLGMTVAGSHANALLVTLFMMLTAFFAAIILPGTQLMVANMAGENERGIVLGAMGSMGTLGRTVATLGSGFLFGQVHIQAPYLGAIVVSIVLALVASSLPRGTALQGSSE
jgi:DHA1 family tetracycline resistance protein-like MFS transporter